MEHAFNPFTDLAQPAIQARAVLVLLVCAAWGPDEVVGLIENAGLPFQAQKAFVGKQIAVGEAIDHGFRGSTLVGIGKHQIIDYWDTIQGADRHQLVAKILQVAAGALAIVGLSGKVTALLVGFVAQYRRRFGIQQIAIVQVPAFLHNPIPLQLFHQ
jgi:hypothetical protein